MIELVIWILFGVACYFVAKEKNRNAMLWGVIGVLFGIFALIVVACLPKVDDKIE